ncbi:hypothetical protein [Streptomyces sp. NPDC057877]|uniref:hypothetical protein n=1 Tax=Streptomyces sp. NPDC057877 TaxID=3346269 RepID=UPI0036B35652
MATTDTLTDRSVFLSLREITEDLAVRVPTLPENREEAWAVLLALAEADGAGTRAVRDAAQGTGETHARIGRRLLQDMLAAPESAPEASAVLADPPTDDQLAAVPADTALVLGSALVVWLSVRFDVKITRRDGKNSYSLSFGKEPSRAGAMAKAVETLVRLFQGDTPPGP